MKSQNASHVNFSLHAICVKRRKYNSYKEAKEHSGNCIKQYIYDICNLQKNIIPDIKI